MLQKNITLPEDIQPASVIACCANPSPENIVSQYGKRIIKISDHQVVKWGPDITNEEAENQQIAYERVDKSIVRIPRVYAFFSDEQGCGYIVMEFIKGKIINPLEDRSAVKKIAGVLDHFATLRCSVPGPLCGGFCRGLLFPETEDLVFHSLNGMENWFNSRLFGQHITAVFPHNYYTNRELWRAFLPHSVRALQGSRAQVIEEKSVLYVKVGQCLMADGRIKEAVNLFEDNCYRWTKFQYAEDHGIRLESQHVLAMAYQADGQIRKAVNLLEHVVRVAERTLAEKHPSQLRYQHELARAYQADGQINKAVNILQHVTGVQEKTLAEEHPDRLKSQYALARAYLADGQISKALNLLKHVTGVQEKTLAEECPGRQASQYALARAYLADGQINKAVNMLQHVAEVKSLSEKHPDRLESENVLAIAKQAYKEKQGHR